MKKFLLKFKRKPNSTKADPRKKIFNSIIHNFLNNNNIKHYFRCTSLGAVFAERFNRTIKDHLKRPVFEKRDGNWIGVLPIITKQ